jgi:hypothetical protein
LAKVPDSGIAPPLKKKQRGVSKRLADVFTFGEAEFDIMNKQIADLQNDSKSLKQQIKLLLEQQNEVTSFDMEIMSQNNSNNVVSPVL